MFEVKLLQPLLTAASAGGVDLLIHGIGFCLLFAGILAVLFTRLHIPHIAAFLFAGILLGPEFSQIVIDPKSIATIADLGLVFLLFLIGLEIDFRKLFSSGRGLLIPGLLQFPLCVLFGWAFARMLQMTGWSLLAGTYTPLYIGFAVAASSSLIVVKLFQERFHLDTVVGRISLGVLIFQDIWAIVVLALQPSFEHPQISPVLFNFAGIALLALVALAAAKLLLPISFRWIAKSPELLLVAATGWCFGIGFLGSHLSRLGPLFGLGHLPLGVSLEMGALIAGASIASLPYSKEVVSKIASVRDFFVTLFFVGLGMGIPRPEGAGVLLLAGAAVVLCLVVRYVIFFPLFYATGMDRRNAVVAGTKLAQMSEFCLVIAYLGQGLGHVSERFVSAIIFAFVATTLLTPLLFDMGDRIHARIGGVLSLLGFKAPDEEAEAEGEAPPVLVFLGFHRVASSLLYDIEQKSPELLPRVLVVDFNVELHAEIARRGVHVMYADISNTETLLHGGLDRARVVISTVSDDLLRGTSNVRLARAVRRINPDAVIIVNALRTGEVEGMLAAGADLVFLPRVEAACCLGPTVLAALEGRAAVAGFRGRMSDVAARREVMP